MMTANRLAYDLGYFAHRVLHLGAIAAEVSRRDRHRLPDDWCDEQEREAQLPVHIEKRGEQSDNSESFAQNNGHRISDCSRDLIYVIGHF